MFRCVGKLSPEDTVEDDYRSLVYKHNIKIEHLKQKYQYNNSEQLWSKFLKIRRNAEDSLRKAMIYD